MEDILRDIAGWQTHNAIHVSDETGKSVRGESLLDIVHFGVEDPTKSAYARLITPSSDGMMIVDCV